MKIDLSGRTAVLAGTRNAVALAVEAGLVANGASIVAAEAPLTPDILVLSHPPEGDASASQALTAMAERVAGAMTERGSGRIVHILSAVGVVPMRRRAESSAIMAGAIAGGANSRTNAMPVPTAPSARKGRRRPKRLTVRSDHPPTNGSQNSAHNLGRNTISAATPEEMPTISVQK